MIATQLRSKHGRKNLTGNTYMGCGRCLLRFALHIYLDRAHPASHWKGIYTYTYINYICKYLILIMNIVYVFMRK